MILESAAVGPFFKNGYVIGCENTRKAVFIDPGDEVCHQTREGKLFESYCSFFSSDYMASLFPEATELPPVSPEWQHCCTLKGPHSFQV